MKTNTQTENDGGVDEPDDEKPAAKKPDTVTENEEDGTVTVSGDDPEERQTRKARRGGRQADEVAKWRQKAEDIERQLAQTRSEMQQELQRVHQRIQAPQQQGEDPYKARLRTIRSEQESIQATFRTGAVTNESEAGKLKDRFYQLDEESRDLDRNRIREEVRQEIARSQHGRPGDGEEAIIKSEFPDVVAHPAALRYALGIYHQLTAEGKPATLATTREAMKAAAANPRFGLTQQAAPPPTVTQQQRYGAVSAQAGAGGSGNDIRLDSAQKKMAIARWPNLEDVDAYRHMAALLRAAPRDEQGE